MGHENVGVIAKAGKTFRRAQGRQGRRPRVPRALYAVHESGAGAIAASIATARRPTGITIRRRSDTATPRPTRRPTSGADFGHYLYLPWNAVLHKVPAGVTPKLAGFGTPLANGIQWSLLDAHISYGARILIQGPGQQGLSQVVAAKQAGADLIIVTGTTEDARRLKVTKALGADTIDVQTEDPLERIMEITSRKGVDFSIDCTAGAGKTAMLRRRGAQAQSGDARRPRERDASVPGLPARTRDAEIHHAQERPGHSYRACSSRCSSSRRTASRWSS